MLKSRLLAIRLQDLRANHPDWLVQHTISFAEGFEGKYVGKFLAVSHRWEEPTEPDKEGKQCAALKAHLDANKSIEFVWYDYWSMPQGDDKTQSEVIEFRVMLPNINLVYLFCSVLVILDLAYLSRFWTQFEAFLSLRKVTEAGLGPAPAEERRCKVTCIHNAPEAFGEALFIMWGDTTAEQAHAVLSKPDVTVTNQSDKDAQLPKLMKLDDLARRAIAGRSASGA